MSLNFYYNTKSLNVNCYYLETTEINFQKAIDRINEDLDRTTLTDFFEGGWKQQKNSMNTFAVLLQKQSALWY